jgi:hypothetical protein
MYSNIRSRAGLVALLFTLIGISLVSAAPIPSSIPQSGLSSTVLPHSNLSHNGQNHIQPSLKGHMSKASPATRVSYKHNTDDTDDNQLRRRNIFKKIGHAIKSAAQKVGSGIKKVATKVASGVKQVAQKAGAGIKKAAQKVGSGIRIAAKKVEHFAKTTGATVAKFGLKVAQTVGNVVAKAASFIPDVGKPLEKAIGGVAKVYGAASDAIHAHISTKLQKGMKVMNTANKVMSYFRRDLSDEELFQQRDNSDAHYFEEFEEFDSDDISLEHLHQEEFYFDNNYEHYLD